jgi:hypothetical protein
MAIAITLEALGHVELTMKDFAVLQLMVVQHTLWVYIEMATGRVRPGLTPP